MATVVIKSKKVCDMCGNESDHFINASNKKFSVSHGVIHSQSDRWSKDILVNITASIPYHPSDDVCVNCLEKTFNSIISQVKGEV